MLVLGGCIGLGLLNACVVVPRATDDNRNCQLHTRNYTLETQSLLPSGVSTGVNNKPDAALYAGGALAVFGGSLVVSGSFVVVNDTAHWIEAQGSCSESETRQAVAALVNSTQAAGGHVLKSKDDVVEWVSHFMRSGQAAGATGK